MRSPGWRGTDSAWTTLARAPPGRCRHGRPPPQAAPPTEPSPEDAAAPTRRTQPHPQADSPLPQAPPSSSAYPVYPRIPVPVGSLPAFQRTRPAPSHAPPHFVTSPTYPQIPEPHPTARPQLSTVNGRTNQAWGTDV